jgi:hypothetical protein
MGNFDEIVKKAEIKVLKNLERKGFNIGTLEESDLQRTAQWFEQRKGRFTGSEYNKLMSCTHSTAKMEWGRAEKLVDFSETAKKYIFSKAKERQRGKVIRIASSHAMKYGTENEPVILELLKAKFPEYVFSEVGFTEFIKDVAGSSPDGKVEGCNIKMALEMKGATTWETLYTRHEIEVDQTHQDFWQLQAEMLSLKVDKCMYAVAEPSESIFEPNITDVSVKFVDASPIHQQAMKQRALIGDAAIKKYLNGVNFHEAIRQAASEFEIE